MKAWICAALLGLSILHGARCLPVDCHNSDPTCSQFAALVWSQIPSTSAAAAAASTATPARYVAGGAQCTIWTSTNGTSWQAATGLLPGCSGTGSVNSVAYGNETFVAVGDTGAPGCGIWTSADYGATWTQRSCPATVTRPLRSVAFGSGLFMTVGTADSALTRYESGASADNGGLWASRTYVDGSVGANYTSTNVAYLPQTGMFVLWQEQTQGQRNFLPAGSTWGGIVSGWGVTQGIMTSGPVLGNGRNRILLSGNGTPVTQYSDTDGTTQSSMAPAPFAGAGAPTRAAVYGSGKRVVLVRDGCEVSTSTDGTAGDAGPFGMSNCSGTNLLTVTYGENQFIAAGQNGNFYFSASGLRTEWTQASSSGSTQSVFSIAIRPSTP